MTFNNIVEEIKNKI